MRTRSEEETVAAGERLARRLPFPCVVLLICELGAGKTTFAKGLLEGLGLATPDQVASPTFTLIHEYGRAYHIDLYRIENERDLATLGLEELLERDAVLIVEWGERFPRLWPPDRIEVLLRVNPDNSREIEFRGPRHGRASTLE
jgi:tRNA threonylcarbamoyladenosine biosynthesis protein TsaE